MLTEQELTAIEARYEEAMRRAGSPSSAVWDIGSLLKEVRRLQAEIAVFRNCENCGKAQECGVLMLTVGRRFMALSIVRGVAGV